MPADTIYAPGGVSLDCDATRIGHASALRLSLELFKARDVSGELRDPAGVETGGQWTETPGSTNSEVLVGMVKRTVDASYMWKNEANNGYGYANKGAIAVREMLQNSMDAVEAAQQRGQVARGEIAINMDPGTKTVRVRDNGIGMSEDVLNNFLTLTGVGSTKSTGGARGGFGLAKAIILGSSETWDWEIRTRANAMYSDEVEGGRLMRIKGPPIQGAEFTIRNIRNWDSWNSDGAGSDAVSVARTILESSDLSRTRTGPLKVTLNGQAVKPKYLPGAGTRLPGFESADWGPGVKANVTAYPVRDEGGHIIVRLNGLYQFQQQMIGSNGQSLRIHKNIVVDLQPPAEMEPSSRDYPFAKNRMSFTYNAAAAQRLDSIKNYFDRESLSGGKASGLLFETFANLRKKASPKAEPTPEAPANQEPELPSYNRPEHPAPPKSKPAIRPPAPSTGVGINAGGTVAPVEVIRGLSGGAMAVAGSVEHGDTPMAAAVDNLLAKIEPVLNSEGYREQSKPFAIVTNKKNWEGRTRYDSPSHAAGLTLWHAFINLVSERYGLDRLSPTGFSTGYILDKGTGAIAIRQGGNEYSLVNPEPLEAKISEAEEKHKSWGLTNYLYGMVCHELAHFEDIGGGHDEAFAARREWIAQPTGELLPALNEIIQTLLPKTAPGYTEPERKARERKAPEWNKVNNTTVETTYNGLKYWITRSSRQRTYTLTAEPTVRYYYQLAQIDPENRVNLGVFRSAQDARLQFENEKRGRIPDYDHPGRNDYDDEDRKRRADAWRLADRKVK